MSEMMMIDRRGGGGKDSREAVERLRYDSLRRDEGKEAPGATVPGSGQPANGGVPRGRRRGARPSRARSPCRTRRGPARRRAGARTDAADTMTGAALRART